MCSPELSIEFSKSSPRDSNPPDRGLFLPHTSIQTMRRIQRIRQPSAVLTQCLHSSPSSAPLLSRATTAAPPSSCLPIRPRDFSTTPSSSFNASRSWAADKEKASEAAPESATQADAETTPTATSSAPNTQVLADVANEKKITEKTSESTPIETVAEPQSVQQEAATDAQTPADTVKAVESDSKVLPKEIEFEAQATEQASVPDTEVYVDTANEEGKISETPAAEIPLESHSAQQSTAPDSQLPNNTASDMGNASEIPLDQEASDPGSGLVIFEPATETTEAAAEKTIRAALFARPKPRIVEMTLPPTERTTAPHPAELEDGEEDAEGYVPATSANDLVVLGGRKDWFVPPKKTAKDKDLNEATGTGGLVQDHWKSRKNSKLFEGFAPKPNWHEGFAFRKGEGYEKRVGVDVATVKKRMDLNRAVTEMTVYRAVMEALAVQAAGPPELLVGRWSTSSGEAALALQLEMYEDGKLQIVGDVPGVVEELRGEDQPRSRWEDVMQAVNMVQRLPEDTRTAVQAVSLEDAYLKFAVCPAFLSFGRRRDILVSLHEVY